MSNSLPPDQRPPRLREDEPIALLVTFLAFGAIFWWALSQGRGTWVTNLIPGLSSSPLPTVAPSPLPTASPVPPGNNQGLVTPASPGTTTPDPTAIVPTPVPQPTVGIGAGTEVVPSPSPTISPTNPAVVRPASPAPGRPVPSVPGKAIAFPDVPPTYWAAPFIAALSAKGIVGGFPDGTFRPDQPVKRAEYAVQLQKAFTKPNRQPPIQFTDVPPGSRWLTAVDQAVKAGFMSGYPEGDFRPEQEVSRAESVISMVQGLKLPEPADPEAILQAYGDRNQVPSWARGRIAAAIQAGIFSSDPDTQLLRPNQPASRADIAALVYQGLEVSGNTK